MDEIVVDLQGVWKIFGDRSKEAMAAVKAENIGKPEVLERFACVVGVQGRTGRVRPGVTIWVDGTNGRVVVDPDEETAARARGLGERYERLEASAAALEDGLRRAAEETETPARINRVGAMLTVFFAAEPVTDFASACRSDTERFAAFFRQMLARGVFLPPSQFEAVFVSPDETQLTLRGGFLAPLERVEMGP